jgi:FAD:protein FMN transferase
MGLTRRRFLTIASAACLAAPAADAYRWQGTALGAHAQIVLDHPRAIAITEAARLEIDRLEDIFSLYRRQSELSELNAAGMLYTPSFDLLECLALARRVHEVTEGRFDPTVQPLWQLLATSYRLGVAPPEVNLDNARSAIGFDRVRFDAAGIFLDNGQGLTLNGIAQGYIADRVARLMQAQGIKDVLIDTGEIVALGKASDQTDWPVTIAGEDQARRLSDRSLATSASLGTTLDSQGQIGHILDPRMGRTGAPLIHQVSVSARSAALADGLSTGLCLAEDRATAEWLLRNVEDARLERLYV